MKVKLLKKQCESDPSKYVWKVNEGCFTIGDTTKQCAPDEIKNPKTGRCVKRSGKIGQGLTQPSKQCAPDEIKNPKTGRCVKRSGKIGQMLLPSPLKCLQMAGFRDFTCKELPLTDIKYVIGPCSFCHFKYGKRNIYLFGEAHAPLERSNALINTNPDMTQSNTIMFAGLIHSLATQNPTRTYDLMFESSYFLEKKGSWVSSYNISPKFYSSLHSISPTFNSITDTFLPCIIAVKRQSSCPYKNLRTHYVDFRKSIEVDPIDTKIDVVPRPDVFNKNVRKLLKSGKVLKQINAIKDVHSRDALIRYANDFLDGNATDYNHIIIMDIYGIARLLREFDSTIEKGNKQFKGTSENIIYYSGALHTTHMVFFFTRYMNLSKSVINKPYIGQCDSFIKLDVGNKSLNFVSNQTKKVI